MFECETDPVTGGVEASVVYLVVRDCSLFPRSERVPWFVKHLLDPKTPLQIINEECTAVTVCVQSIDGQFHNLLTHQALREYVHANFPSFIIEKAGEARTDAKTSPAPSSQITLPHNFYVTPSTRVVVAVAKYRLVVSVDVTPSMAAIDPVTGCVLFDQVLITLEKCLVSLCDSPIEFPGMDVQFRPQIYISVLAQGFLPETLRVLLQGVLLERQLIPSIMSTLKLKLRVFESQMATIYSAGLNSPTPLYKRAVSELSSCVHKSVFALKLLPPDACPGLILVSDGVTSAPDITAYDNMTMLLNREDITCTAILVGSGPHLHCAFGYTPDTEVLRHLATSTCGAYIERSYLPSGGALQELLLLKTFSPTPSSDTPSHISNQVMDGEAVVGDMGALHTMMAVDYPFPWVGPPPMVPLLQTQHKTYALECDLPRIVDVRVREGFVVTAASADDNLGKERVLSVRLILGWLPNIKVAYSIQVSIGPQGPSSKLKIELTVLAYYEFLHQFMKNEKSGTQVSSSASSVTKLQSFLQNIHETDLVLSYLFSQCQGTSTPMPPPNVPVAPPTIQAQYKAFWKTMNGLRNHSWHRWLKTEKIGILLSPMVAILDLDHAPVAAFPLPRPRAVYPAHFLYDPPTAILLDYCTRWATFHQSKQLFVKFLDPPPGVTSLLLPSPSFCVVRLSFETSGFVIMQLAFFSVHPLARAETVASLRQDLSELMYPRTATERDVIGANPVSAQRALVVGPPVTPISRSIRTLLVRYDPIPAHSGGHGPSQSQPHHSPARLVFNHTATPLPSFSPLLAWYMWRHRWVWILPDTSIAEQMLGILIECRLKEGFTLVNVAYGIYTFIKEFSLQTPKSAAYSRVALPCTLQYVVFVANPHSLTTELWMEPQQGRYAHERGESSEAELFLDLKAWFESTDTKVVSALSTLYLLDSADIRDRKLDLSSYPRNHGPPAGSQALSVYYLVHPASTAFPPRRLDILSQFAVEKFERSYPLLTLAPATNQRDKSAGDAMNGHTSSDGPNSTPSTPETTLPNHHSSTNSANAAPTPSTNPNGATPTPAHTPSTPNTNGSAALLDAVNAKLYTMVADCMAWLSDYEVYPDKELNDDQFKRGRSFVKIIRTHPRIPPRSHYVSPLLATRLVLVHLQAPRDRAGVTRKSLEVSFYILSSDSFRCPPPPNSAAAERVSSLFMPKEIHIISADQDDDEEEVGRMSGELEPEEDEESGEEGDQQQDDEAHVAHTIVEEYLAQINQAYKRCFAKAVYTHLRSHGAVSPQDLSSCLEVLHASHLDVDLSEFLQIISIAKTLPSQESHSDIQREFSADMAHYFSRVPLPDSPYFFYHPQPRELDSEDDDGDEYYGYDKKADVEYDDPQPDTHATESLELCPPFIGEMEGDMDSKDAMGIYSLPLLLRMEAIKGKESSGVITAIPTSATGPTTLRFICMVLPPLIGPARLLHESICMILQKHKRRIVALLSAKILTSLLAVHPLTDPMLETVTRHLASLSPKSSSSKSKAHSRHAQSNTFELLFVDWREGTALFPQELKSSRASPTTSAETPALTHLSGDLYTLATTPDTPAGGQIIPRDGDDDSDDEGGDGMGDDELPPNYWLLLTCKMDATSSVVATLFVGKANHPRQSTPVGSANEPSQTRDEQHDDAHAHEIWRGIRFGISAVARRVNQLILLEHLHESRICAELLLPESPPAQHGARGGSGKDDKDAKSRVGNFRPGEFECPLVHTITLPLHERATISTARALMLTALHPFEVANHNNLFVYHQKNGRIFYICLRTAATTQPSPTPSHDQPLQTSPPPSPSLPVHGISQASITLHVYGVDPAGPEITQHLHQHLENKLSTSALNSLSDLFMRNPLLKLTTEDLDFLRSTPAMQASSAPKNPQTIVIQIPQFVSEPYTYLLFLKQNLMQFLQTVHLSQAAQQREDADVSAELTPTHERYFMRPSEFMLMYNHISSPTSAPPFSTIGSGMACVSLALLDTNGACMTSIARSSTRTCLEWTQEDLQVAQLPDDTHTPKLPHADATWSNKLLMRIWNRQPLNIPALVTHLVQCANQTLCEYVLETSLHSSLSVPLEDLPSYMHNTEGVLSRAKMLAAPSVYKNTFTIPLPTWVSQGFLAELRDIISDVNPALSLQVLTCYRDADGTTHCVPSQPTSGARACAESTWTSLGCPCEDAECSYATATADFYCYDDDESAVEISDPDLDFASAMLTQRGAETSYVLWGGKKTEPNPPTKTDQPALFYPPFKNTQLTEPIVRQCLIAVRVDMPRDYEQGYKMTVYTYDWEQTKLDIFKDRCARLVSLCALKQHLVGTIAHHKMGLFHHQPSLPSTSVQPPSNSKFTWESIESIVAPQSTAKRRLPPPTQDSEKHKDDKEQESDADHKKMRPDPHRPARPALEFDSVFRDHYHPAPNTSSRLPSKDPVQQLAAQSKTLAMYIEQRAALRTAAMGSISILPSPSSTSPAPLTSFQLDSVINIARLVHFRCVPFLFGEQIMEFGPVHAKPSLPILDAFVRDYVEYLSGLGVRCLLVDKGRGPITATKRVLTRAYLQKVFLDGTLLVKISFREGSVACELFAVPQFDLAAQTPQFSSQPARHFGEELTRFTRILHLNSFTYDFHVTQLYRMIQFPSTPSTPSPTPTTPTPTHPAQSICSILQALHQYYPTPPMHASTCLDSFPSACPAVHLSPELPEITTNQILEFMMLDEVCAADAITPLRHIGVLPALLLRIAPSSPYSDLYAVVFAKEALPEIDEECGCGTKEEDELSLPTLPLPVPPDLTDENARLLHLHVFVVKVGDLCALNPSQRPPNFHMADNLKVLEKLHKATTTSSVNYQRNQLWYKLQRGNPYSPALTHPEFQLLTQLAFSRPATTLDPTLIHPVNILKLGSGVWHQLLAQLRSVGGERVRQVFADPVHHLLIFHPSNNSQLVHFVWNEAEKEAHIFLCRLDRASVGIPASDEDEISHVSHLITFICHFIWKLLLVKQ